MTSQDCPRCKNIGIIYDDPASPFASYLCGCEHGAAARRVQNRWAIDQYRLNGSEPITSASNAAAWDEVESAIDLVREQHRHLCRGCDLTLPLGSKCGGYCRRCQDEIQAQSRPKPTFSKTERWVLGFLGTAALIVIAALVKTMVWG